MKICYLYSNHSSYREYFIQSLSFEVTLVNSTKEVNWNESDYDLVFFDEADLCDCIEKKNCFSIPIVYCMIDQNKPVRLFANLYRMLIFSPFTALNLYGLPSEMYLNYWPFVQKQGNRRSANVRETNNILHIPSHNDTSLYCTRTLIKIFNQFLQYKLTICYRGDPSELQHLCNPNIVIRSTSLGNIEWDHYQALIGSEEIAVSGLLNHIPVIVAGRKGIGGVVTPENVKSFTDFRFEGRIGGEVFEYIPPKILFYELEKINNTDLSTSITDIYNYLVGHLFYCFSDDKIMSKFQEIICICKDMNENKYESVFPILSRNIRIIETEGDNYLSNNLYNVFLGELDNDASEWLKRLNGKASLKELTKDYSKEEILECGEFIKDLWNKKAIMLSPERIDNYMK